MSLTLLRTSTRAICAIAMLSLLPGCTGLSHYGHDRLRDLGEIPIVGAGWGGLVIFGPGGGFEVSAKVTEAVQPVVGASEMLEFEVRNGDCTRFEERSVGFPPATLYNLITGHTLTPPIAVRQGRAGYLGMLLRMYRSDFTPRHEAINTRAIPAPMQRDVTTEAILGTEGMDALNHWWFITPWFDSREPVLHRFDLEAEATAALISLRLGLSLGQLADFLAGLVGFDPGHDDDYPFGWGALGRRAEEAAAPGVEPSVATGPSLGPGEEVTAPLVTRPRPGPYEPIPELEIIYFDYDSSALDDEDRARLDRNVEWLRANPDVAVLIEGHCDERGTDEYNYALGERRANAVLSYLRAAGVPNELATRSFGESRPAVEGHDESAWRWNRRAVFSRYVGE